MLMSEASSNVSVQPVDLLNLLNTMPCIALSKIYIFHLNGSANDKEEENKKENKL